MGQDTAPRTEADGSQAKRVQLAAAILSGQEKRRRNRELLLEREHAQDPPPNATLAVVKLLLCAVLFLPLIALAFAIVMGIEARWGTTASWIVGVAVCGLLAAVIYNGPRLVRSSATDVYGLFKYRKQNPAAFWGAIAMVVVMILLVYLALNRNPAIH